MSVFSEKAIVSISRHLRLGDNLLLDQTEVFKYLCQCLSCKVVLQDGFHDKFAIHAGDDGELHVYKKLTSGQSEELWDARGELFCNLIDIGMEICPNWDNRWPYTSQHQNRAYLYPDKESEDET